MIEKVPGKQKRIFWGAGMFGIFILVVVIRVCTYLNICWVVHLRFVHFMYMQKKKKEKDYNLLWCNIDIFIKT